jgi:AraC-like DNA-binding protein
MKRPLASDFFARIRHRSQDALKIIDCVCDPCGATRHPKIMGRDPREILGLQLVLDGRETVQIGNDRIELTKGDILLWDNTRPMTFAVRERLHKLSFIMPLSRFKNWLPSSWHSIERKIPAGSNAGDLLSIYMTSLSAPFLDSNSGNGDALTEATIGLVVNALGHGADEPVNSLREAQVLRVKRFIDQHLDEPDLSPGRIATANRISVRYLHWLFEPLGLTVTRYIIQQRLQRCRRELSNPVMCRRTISDIAFSWGFHNPTHFSRRFKQEFGLSPLDFRRRESSGLSP